MAEMKGARSEGDRASRMRDQRAKMLAEMEKAKDKIRQEIHGGVSADNFNQSFKSNTSMTEEKFKMDTVGLVTYEDFKKKREALELEKMKEEAAKEVGLDMSEPKKKKKKKRNHAVLSFADGDEDEEADEAPVRKKKMKNPDVDTSFLPDRDRELEEAMLRKQLESEWIGEQDKIKSEEIEITYSYWDGSGHRRTVMVKKGHTVEQFLEAVLRSLRVEFSELKSVSADNMIYVKEDLLIPAHYTFYYFIVNKSRGKSGPLFSFDVHDDIRLTSDASVEKDETHAGKVVTRHWYEANKHIFPAMRWEVFDPKKKYDRYTISDNSK